MRFLRLAALAVFAFGVTDAASAAEEFYGMAKLSLCKLPNHPFEYIGLTTATAFSLDGARVAIGSENRTVHVCETAGNLITSIPVPSALAEDDEYVNILALNSDGTRLATITKDKLVRLWDVAAGREIAALAHPSLLYFASFSPDGSRLISSVGDEKLWLWDAASGKQIAVLEHPARVTSPMSAAFSPDGSRLAAATVDGSVHLWNAADGEKIATLSGHTDTVRSARFSADGTLLVTASEDTTARIWDAARGIGTIVLRHPAEVLSAAFSADGKKVVTAAGTQAHIFDAALGRETAVLTGHEYEVRDAAFSPDGTRIVTAGADTIRVWDSATNETVAVLPGHLGGGASFAAFTPDGGRIVSIGGPDGLAWTKIPAGKLPESAAGIWFTDFGSPEQPLPEEIIREMCVSNPIKVSADGLIVFFEQYGREEPPHGVMHLRCAGETSCQIFAEAPAQGLEMQGEGSVKFTETRGELCMGGECRPIAQCAPIVWTDEERASGQAERWETAILGKAQ